MRMISSSRTTLLLVLAIALSSLTRRLSARTAVRECAGPKPVEIENRIREACVSGPLQ